MQFTKISAPLIFKGDDSTLDKKVIVLDNKGEILAIEPVNDHDPSSILFIEKAICPGFINTHCHLELSHLKGLVDTGTTLIPFIKHVVANRNFPQEIIQEAIQQADEYMYKHGISAVGDISNKIDTKDTKNKSHICYYTFVEMFDLMNASLTNQAINQYQEVFDLFTVDSKNKKSIVPHAPYSVTKKMFEYIQSKNENSCTISIHNQETIPENIFFQSQTGGFVDLYKEFGILQIEFYEKNCNSIEYAIDQMNPHCPTLFIHNTLTNKDDIKLACNWNNQIYWTTCANANLYIENKLPDYKLFIDSN
ncbi:MAG: hypothetical protein RLZZ546_1554, partial [Bacteroidota bacterium]